MQKKVIDNSFKIALIGNPNCGKTSLFNILTGLHQKVANYPGVTVEKKSGYCNLNSSTSAEVIDLPGTYSLFPKSIDEYVAFDVLLNKNNSSHPDVLVVVVDASNLKRNLLFCSQIIDLGKPTVLALNMLDVAKMHNIAINTTQLEELLGVPIIPINARNNVGINDLKNAILQISKNYNFKPFIPVKSLQESVVAAFKNELQCSTDYSALLTAHHYINIFCLDLPAKEKAKSILTKNNFNSAIVQGNEILLRYDIINEIIAKTVTHTNNNDFEQIKLNKLDKILTHPVWGYTIFIFILFLVFQLIFNIAEYPKGIIENAFLWFSNYCTAHLKQGFLTDLFVNGILAGASGVFTFLPQIMLLFGFITLLEDSGYMARISFLMDKLMCKVGLSGKSVVPLVGGLACAVPAIMSARTIENKKERIITLMVLPLMSCSARLPVYTLLISLLSPSTKYFYFINLQGLLMLGMYLAGFVMVVLVSIFLKFYMKAKERSLYIVELPVYRVPKFKNLMYSMYIKAKNFTLDTGKVIIIVSVVLWMLSSFGPIDARNKINSDYQTALLNNRNTNIEPLQLKHQADLLEHSYAGILGKTIEPIISPLGFDWKIGIALVTSFAAREVFVGTMSTLYSVSSADNSKSIQEKMMSAKKEDGTPVYSLATLIALLLYYAFAIQCISTISIMYKETRSWKLTLVQIILLTGIAYCCSLFAYQLLK